MATRRLQNARILVTGASAGIGREIALQLAAKKALLLLTARRADRLEELATEIESDHGVAPLWIAGDITDPNHRSALLETCQSKLGGLDALINNAGIGAIGRFDKASQDRLRQVMEVNFFAPVELTRAALPLLREGQRPIIVNVSSVLGHRAVPKKSEYCASKFALHGFSDALRAELSETGIDVLLVSPSTTKTEFFDNVIENEDQLPWLALGGQNPRSVAKAAVSAMGWGRHEIILTAGGKLLVWLDRLCPPFINRLVAWFG
ncbi:MAG: short-subunit dehydrogenase [Pirellulaceae bacterium]